MVLQSVTARNAAATTLFVLTAACFARSSLAQGNGTSINLDAQFLAPQPIFSAPENFTGTLRLNGSYSLTSSGSTLVGNRSSDVLIAANSSVFIHSFTRANCATLRLSGGSTSVYGFVTRAGLTESTGAGGVKELMLRRDPDSLFGESYDSSSLASNRSISGRLALGPLLNSSSGPASTNVSYGEQNSIVLVNPTGSSQAVRVDASLSPYGPCRPCNDEVGSGGFLGAAAPLLFCNYHLLDSSTPQQSQGARHVLQGLQEGFFAAEGTCGEDNFLTGTVTFDNESAPYSADLLEPLLVPEVSSIRELVQGKTSLFAVFTNAACLLYTIKQSSTASNLDVNNALLSAWVVPSTEQQLIVSSGSVTSRQRLSMPCTYPFTSDLQRPCAAYNDTLDASETYYLWVENNNGGTQTSNGTVSVQYELITLADAAECSMGSFYNLSLSAAYLADSSGLLPMLVNASDTRQVSPYDPGVTAFSFLGALGNTDFNYPIQRVGSDGSLSQAGFWNVSNSGLASGLLDSQVTLQSMQRTVLNTGTARLPYGSAGSFSNAQCFSIVVNATDAVTSFLLPRTILQANYNYSAALPPLSGLQSAAYDNSLPQSRSFRQQNAQTTTFGLSAEQTYTSVVNGAVRNGTVVMTSAAAYPPGAARCLNLTGPSSGSALAPAPASAPASRAARGVYDRWLIQLGEGGSDNMATLTGAACIAFSFSGRGTAIEGRGPTLFDQYYNTSFPGNSSGPTFSASAFLLAGSAVNRQFVSLGFPAAINSTTTIDIATGCKINNTNPGPCTAYADNLNSSDIYYLWGVIGASSPSSWVLLSFEALPSGSCRSLYAMTSSAPVVPAASSASSSSSGVSAGVIVGPVVGGLAVLAVIIIGLICLRRRRQEQKRTQTKQGFNVTQTNPWDEVEPQYADFKDAMGNEAAINSVKSPFVHSQKPGDSASASVGEQTGSKRTAEESTTSSIVVTSGPENVGYVQLSSSSGKVPASFGSGGLADMRDQWEIDLTALKIKVVDGKPVMLGEGGFGCVYLGFLGVRDVAVKIASGKSDQQKERFLHEILILKGCRDPGVVQFLGASVGEEQIVLVMEFMPGGNLYSAIQGDPDGSFLWHRNGWKLALDVAKGLYHLHSKSIVHMDLKTPNILLTASKEQAKISDVGLAKYTSDAGTTATQGASLMWASPEQLLSGKCTAASDMFSFGVVLWEICTGESPVRSRHYRELQVPEECPQAVADLINSCLDATPSKRPTAQAAHEILTRCARSMRGQSSKDIRP